jgi:uncharacterized LabA/DUF88 family protein
MTSRTNVYIDAFNLYYGCLKGTPYRWLDLEAFCQLLLPRDNIQRIKYFTARISARPNDPGKPTRQQTYLRALGTLPRVSIVYGHYLSHVVRMPLANPQAGGPRFAEVIKTEEKGSDVNLATHLLHDAWRDDYDAAVVITNDSDLVEPIRIVKKDLGKTVGMLNPQKHPSNELRKHCDFIKQIRTSALARSQFAPVLLDATGQFHKPATW